MGTERVQRCPWKPVAGRERSWGRLVVMSGALDLVVEVELCGQRDSVGETGLPTALVLGDPAAQVENLLGLPLWNHDETAGVAADDVSRFDRDRSTLDRNVERAGPVLRSGRRVDAAGEGGDTQFAEPVEIADRAVDDETVRAGSSHDPAHDVSENGGVEPSAAVDNDDVSAFYEVRSLEHEQDVARFGPNRRCWPAHLDGIGEGRDTGTDDSDCSSRVCDLRGREGAEGLDDVLIGAGDGGVDNLLMGM